MGSSSENGLPDSKPRGSSPRGCQLPVVRVIAGHVCPLRVDGIGYKSFQKGWFGRASRRRHLKLTYSGWSLLPKSRLQ